MKYTAKEIVSNGKLINRWPCDAGLDGSVQSNGSQEFLYEYQGNSYTVWMNWDDSPVEPEKIMGPDLDEPEFDGAGFSIQDR